MSAPAELLHITRGSLIEVVLRGHVAVVDDSGALLASCGDPDDVRYMRSSAKPLQALPVVLSGAAQRYAIAGPLLAVCCASHLGEPGHVEAVCAVLDAADVPVDALQCGIHPPASVHAAADLWRSGLEPTLLHNNCSGKHAGMLVAARALGTPLDRYLDPEGSVQQAILAAIVRLGGVPASRVVLGVDGCSAPVHGLPLRAMAQAYAHLANPSSAPDDAHALHAVANAMTAHPWYVRGTDGADTMLMERGSGRLISKAGAEGVLCVGVRGRDGERGIGIAIKVESGRGDTINAVAIAVLRALGLFDAQEIDALGDLAHPPVRNHRGTVVGAARPVLNLHTAAQGS